MSQPRIKAGWHLLNADNGDILATTMTGGEARLERPDPAIRELLRRLALDESLTPFDWLPGIPATEAERRVRQWCGELDELGLLDHSGESPSAEWQQRYGGQMAFLSSVGAPKDTGLAAQKRLADRSVALLGLGTQNSWMAFHLAVAGVGQLRCADAEVISAADVPGSPLWRAEDLGRRKSEAFAEAIGRINPLVEAVGREVLWQSGMAALPILAGADLALVDLGGRGLWDDQGLDRSAHQACFQSKVPAYLMQNSPLRLQWGPLLAPGAGACYACLSAKLAIPEGQRLADQGRWLNPSDPLAGGFRPMAAEVAALAMPELILFLAGILSAESLQRTTFLHVPARGMQTITMGPDANCDWCGVGTPAYADRAAHYARLDVRPMAFADKSYPSDPQEAEAQIGRWLAHADKPAPRMPRGIIAPHIEPRLGQVSYGHAYGAFPKGQFPRRIVLLATSHYAQSRVVAVSQKPFVTPWGLLDVDKRAVARLAAASGGNAYADEALFGYEHAIEFPAIFVEQARRQSGEPPVQVVPVLCGSLMPAMHRDLDPMQVPEVAGFVGALQELVAEDPAGTCVVASIDLSHMGPRYGDPRPMNPEEIHRIETWDQGVLAHLAQSDAKGYWDTVAGVGNGTRICGLTPLYLLAAALPELQGELRHYELALDAASRSHIGHAAMLLY